MWDTFCAGEMDVEEITVEAEPWTGEDPLVGLSSIVEYHAKRQLKIKGRHVHSQIRSMANHDD